MKEYIYILQIDFIQNSIKNCCKIGSTRNLQNRISSYKTYYPIFNNANAKLLIYEYEHDKYNCYFVDELLKQTSTIYNYPFDKYTNIGGTEYYIYNDTNNFDNLLSLLNIKFIKYNVNVEDLFTSYNLKTECKEIKNAKKIDVTLLNNVILKIKENIINKIKLKNWQIDAKEQFFNFIKSSSKSGVLISPTGAGKTFLFCVLVLEYIKIYKKDVLIITKKKEIFCDLETKINELMNNGNYLNINVRNLIEKYDDNMFKNESLDNNIYIINTDKFVSSTKYNDYKNYSFGKIKLVIHDECHWSSSEKIYDFLTYLKNNVVDKLLGLSATPCRILEKHQNRTNEIFGENNYLNVVYQRGLLEAIDEKDILAPKWSFFNVTENDINEIGNIYKLNEIGKNKITAYINNLLKNSAYKKGVLWFRTKNDILDYYEFVKKNNLLQNIKLYPSFSKSSKPDKNTFITDRLSSLNISYDDINNNLYDFKKTNTNAILLVVYRASEGFDDPKIDFGIRMYLGESIDPLLEYQRMGRTTRICEKKMMANYITIELLSNEILRDNYIKKLGNWIKFVSEFTQKNIKNNTQQHSIKQLINSFFDFDTNIITHIEIENIKNDIIKYAIGNNIQQFIKDENTNRYHNNKSLILTKNECLYFLKQHGLEIKKHPKNWLYYCLDEQIYNIVKNKYYKINELNDIFKKLNINNLDDYEKYHNKDNKLPSFDLIDNGFYYEKEQEFNINTFISNMNDYLEF